MNKIKHIEVNIGKACNNKCRFCMSAFVGQDEKELIKFEIIKEEIKRYYDKGYKSIGFLGGDISIHPRIFDVIFESKELGYDNISIITNAMLFSDFIKAEKLVKSGVTRVNISIHSHDSQVEDYLTQIPGGFKRKLNAIDNFNKLHDKGLLKSPISINIVLNGLNYKNILKTCIFFHKTKKINDIRINFLWNRFFTSEKDKNLLELKYEDFLPSLKSLIIYSIKNNLRITFDSIPQCIFKKLNFKDTDFIIDNFLGENKDHIEEISNLNKKDIFNWKDQKENELKMKFDKCNNCIYFKKCQGLWKEYVERFGNNEFNPIFNR